MYQATSVADLNCGESVVGTSVVEWQPIEFLMVQAEVGWPLQPAGRSTSIISAAVLNGSERRRRGDCFRSDQRRIVLWSFQSARERKAPHQRGRPNRVGGARARHSDCPDFHA